MYPTIESYINIHTHHKRRVAQEFIVRNAYLRQLKILKYPISRGLHPWNAHTLAPELIYTTLNSLLIQPMTWAIGEIGIDRINGPSLGLQIEVLNIQLQVATEQNLPVIWHVVRAYTDIVPFIKRTGVPHIIHHFNGNQTEASKLIDLGCILSFGNNLFNYRSDDILRQIPASAFMLETDTAAHLHIVDIYEKAAEIRKTEMSLLKAQVFHNFDRIFGKHRQ
jgi:TatD DNase family protein